eukprot:372975-Prorocentrum_lima.AAC.1
MMITTGLRVFLSPPTLRGSTSGSHGCDAGWCFQAYRGLASCGVWISSVPRTAFPGCRSTSK